MPFSDDMVYLRFEFTWLDTGEIQDTGVWCRLDITTGQTLNWGTAVNEAAEQGVAAWIAGMAKPLFSPSVVANRCIAYHYDLPLKNVLDRGEAGFSGPNAWKGSGINDLPPENTLVLGLYSYDPATYVPNRARRRGRMYLPTPSTAQIGGGGMLTTGTQNTWAAAGKTFLNTLQATIDVPSNAHLRPQVVSRGGNGGAASSANHQVSHVRMGRVMDTQRRRRNALPEEYVTVAL